LRRYRRFPQNSDAGDAVPRLRAIGTVGDAANETFAFPLPPCLTEALVGPAARLWNGPHLKEFRNKSMTSAIPTPKPPLTVMLCSPRGFCAGVVRAIDTVERALARYGKPVYVRHEIVHNRYVVESLRQKGAVFVEELDEIPDENVPVIFSAHGVPKSIPVDAGRRNLLAIDATCPLVTKVHREAEIHFRRGREIVLIGHAGHPEVTGTMGQLPQGAVRLVQTAQEAATFVPNDPAKLAYVTQTTLSVDDTADIVAALKARFPHIAGPHKEDICYATTNRQEAVKKVAPVVDAMIVVGSPNSSNSQRLKEVALRNGCPHAELLQRAGDIDWDRFGSIARLGLTAGASAPEVLIEEIIDAFAARFEVSVETVSAVEESGIFFPLPRQVRGEAAE
jgi:4-hydroxy-3-methylbut-2-en-1-yl diphosphate reductase